MDKNYPCLITAIELPLTLPADLQLNVEKGDLCDIGAARTAAEELRKKLHEAGYREAWLRYTEIVYDTMQRHGKLKLQGQLGRKITHSFVDEEGEPLANFFLEGVNTKATVGGHCRHSYVATPTIA